MPLNCCLNARRNFVPVAAFFRLSLSSLRVRKNSHFPLMCLCCCARRKNFLYEKEKLFVREGNSIKAVEEHRIVISFRKDFKVRKDWKVR